MKIYDANGNIIGDDGFEDYHQTVDLSSICNDENNHSQWEQVYSQCAETFLSKDVVADSVSNQMNEPPVSHDLPDDDNTLDTFNYIVKALHNNFDQRNLVDSPVANIAQTNIAPIASTVIADAPKHLEKRKKPSIHEHIRAGDLQAVKEIIDKKNPKLLNKVDRKNELGNTPLHTAVMKMYYTTPDQTVRVNKKIETIFWALVRAGADLSITNSKGQTPLFRPLRDKDLAEELWLKRESFGSEEFKINVMKGCFQVLSKVWIHEFLYNTAVRDLELLFLTADNSEKVKFLSSNLSHYNRPPLHVFCDYYMNNPESDREKSFVKLAHSFLDSATPSLLTQTNTSGESFLMLAKAKELSNLIDYAKSCQNGALSATVEEFFATSDQFQRQTQINAITLLQKRLIEISADCSKTKAETGNDDPRTFILQAYYQNTQHYSNSSIPPDNHALEQWLRTCEHFIWLLTHISPANHAPVQRPLIHNTLDRSLMVPVITSAHLSGDKPNPGLSLKKSRQKKAG